MATIPKKNLRLVVADCSEPTASDLIPPGEYTLAYERSHLTTRFRRGSLELWFKVADFGPHFGKPICRYFKVQRSGKRSFRVSRHSAFAREFAAIFSKPPPAGLAALQWFPGVSVVAEVGTVTRDHGQQQIPDAARYNIIRRLVGRART